MKSESIEPNLKSTFPLKAALFVFFLALYLATMPNTDLSNCADSKYMFWVCQSLVEDGDIKILNQGIKDAKDKNDYRLGTEAWMTSKYPIGPSLVGIPFYLMAKWWSRIVGRTLSNNDLFYAVSFSSPVISALICLLLFQFILAMGFSPRAAFLSTCCYGLATIAWSTALYYIASEPITTLGILGAVYTAYLYKTKGGYLWLYLSGFLSGVAVASREISVLIIPPVLIYLISVEWKKAKNAPLKSKLRDGLRDLSIFLLGLTPFLVLNVWYTFARYGQLTNIGYLSYGGKVLDQFHSPFLIGLYGFLLSPGSSLFLYCPVLVFVFFSVKSFYTKHKAELILFFSIFLIHLVVYAKYDCWYGGVSFGPRYLVPTIPLLILPMAPFMETLPAKSSLTKVFVLLIFCTGVMIQTAFFWGAYPSEWQTVLDAADKLPGRGEELATYLPQSFPLLWTPKKGDEVINQFYFVPSNIRSLRLPILMVLLSTIFSAGFYLVKKMHLMPDRNGLGSFAARMAAYARGMVRIFLAYKMVAFISAILLIVLAIASYASFKYALVPLMRFNSRPFGPIEHPSIEYPSMKAPFLTGKIEVAGWVLDRSGIRKVEIHIDDVKVADAKYGEPSLHVGNLYPYIPNSDHAGYIATEIDTFIFSNGMHVLLVKALNQKGIWSDVDHQVVFFLNEKPYDFWAHLEEAKTGGEAIVKDTMLSINQEPRRVILQRSNSQVTFENIPVHDQAFLKLGIGIARESEPEDGNGLVLEVVANSSDLLFSIPIDPEVHPRKWHDMVIDLSRFQNQVISMTLIAKTEVDQDDTYSHIGWSTLSIVYPNEEIDPK